MFLTASLEPCWACRVRQKTAIGYDSINVQKMYLAGALHDIGKMAVGNEILEKPDKLTDDEFSKMKNHAGYTCITNL